MKQYDTNERMMYLNEIRISIEIENDDYSKRDELLKCLRRNYEIRFIKENSSYANKKYLQYELTPKDKSNLGRKRILSPEDESEIKLKHYDEGYTLDDLSCLFCVSKATICRTLKR